jgi:DNA-binding SARP family transcriptional activator
VTPTAPSARVRLLSDIVVGAGVDAVRPRAGRVATLLALLALDADRVVPTDHLMDELWDEDPPRSGVAALYVHVSRLRQQLEPLGLEIIANPTGYRLTLAADAVDALEFEKTVAAGEAALHAGDLAGAASAAERAGGLWPGGEPFTGAHATARLRSERERLMRVRARSEELRVRVALAQGDARRAATAAAELTAADPFDEGRWILRIEAEHAAGNTAAALRSFEEARDALARTLGVDPSAALRELHARVLRASAVAPPPAARPAPRRRTVGRGESLRALSALLESAARGEGGVVMLEGDAGIGKTHLAEAAIEEAAERGFTVLRGRAVDGAGAPSLWLWRRVLDALPGAPAPESAESGEADIEDDRERMRRAQAVADRVGGAVRGPTLIALDDIHWADAASLAALRVLASTLDGRPLAIVVTARTPESRRLEVASTLGALARQPGAHRRRLPPLTTAEVGQFLRLAGTPRRAGDAEMLRRRTGGNPFFLRELLVVDDPGGHSLPDSVADLIAVRLGEASPQEGRILELAAIGGLDIDVATLRAAVDLPADAVVEGLARAETLGLVREREGAWAFVHSLARDGILARMDRPTTAARHAAYADALARRADPDDDRLDALAYHRFRAAAGGVDAAAAAACIAAADRARDALAFDRAAQFRARAVALLPPGEDVLSMKAGLLASLCEEQRATGDVQAAAKSLREAVRLARRLDDRRLLVRVLSQLGGITLWNWRQFGEVDRATVQIIETVLEGRDSELPAADEAVLTGALAVELYYGDEDDQARSAAAAARAVETAEGVGNDAILSQVLSNQVIALWRRGSEHARQRVLDRWLTLAQPAGEIVARLHRASIRLALADVDGFVEDSGRAGELIPRLGRMEMHAQRLAQEVGLSLLLGHTDRAQEDIARTAELLGRTSLWGGEWTSILQRFTLARLTGSQASLADELLGLAVREEYRTLRWAALLCLAEAGRLDEARAFQTRWNLRRMPHSSSWNSAFDDVLAAEVAVLLGTPLLTDAYEVVSRAPAELVVVGTALACWGPREAVLARLADRLGATDRARAHRRRAAEVTERVAAQLGVTPVWPGLTPS